MRLDPSGAAQALTAAEASRRRFALSQAHWPWSRHAAFGLVLGGLATAQAAPNPFNVVADVGLMLVSLAIAREDRRRRGVFVNGWRRGRTLWVTLPVVLLASAAGLFGLWLARERGLAWGPAVLGAALLPVGTLASKAWERVYRRELQETL